MVCMECLSTGERHKSFSENCIVKKCQIPCVKCQSVAGDDVRHNLFFRTGERSCNHLTIKKNISGIIFNVTEDKVTILLNQVLLKGK